MLRRARWASCASARRVCLCLVQRAPTRALAAAAAAAPCAAACVGAPLAWGLGRPAARAPAAFHSRRLRRRARASPAPCRASPSAKARRPSASVACVLTKLVNVRVRHARRRRKARGDALRARTAGVAWAPAARLLAAHRPMPPPRGPPAVARPRRICRATGLQCCGRVFPDCRVAGFSRILLTNKRGDSGFTTREMAIFEHQ